MSNLKNEFKYYLDNQDLLIKEYLNKFLIIKEEKVQEIFNSHDEAFEYAIKKFELGTFIIQHCVPGDSGHTQTFHSRVILTY